MNWRDVPMPDAIAALPKDARGFPVPAFVYRPATWQAGEPLDLRVLDPRGVLDLMQRKRCGVCAQPCGYRLWFIGGPMCLANRIFEAPTHHACALYSLRACPHLNNSEHEYSSRPHGPNTSGDPNLIKTRPRYQVLVSTRGYKILTHDETGRRLAKPLAKIDPWSTCDVLASDGTPTGDTYAVLDAPTERGFRPALYCFACISAGKPAISFNPRDIEQLYCASCHRHLDAQVEMLVER
jgi:hypothetical protein